MLDLKITGGTIVDGTGKSGFKGDVGIKDGKYTITTSELEVVGRVAGIDQAAFERAVQEAERACPVSRALAGNVEIRSQGRLEESVQASS